MVHCDETYINVGNTYGQTSLHLAVENRHASVLRILLEQDSVDANKGDNEGKTPLHAAAKLGHDDMVKVLLGHDGTNVNKGRNSDGQTPLHVASENGHLEVVKLLLSHGNVEVNMAKNTTGATALWMAASSGHEQVVRELLHHDGVDINHGDDFGESALIGAAKNGHTGVVELLLDQPNIDINHATKNKKTALILAASFGHEEIVQLLLAQLNIGINTATLDGRTALLYAALGNRIEVVILLLRCPRTETHLLDDAYKTAVDYAREKGFADIVKTFESRGGLISQNGHSCCSDKIDRGFTTAIELNDLSWVRTFIKCPQLDINARDLNGDVSLFHASKANHKQMVSVLLSSPEIDINKQAIKNKETPLMASASEGNPAVVKLLLQHVQIDVNIEDSHGRTALEKAVERGEARHLRVVKLFLRCEMTKIPKEYNKESDIGRAIDMKEMFLEMSPACCLHKVQDLFRAARVGDYRYEDMTLLDLNLANSFGTT